MGPPPPLKLSLGPYTLESPLLAGLAEWGEQCGPGQAPSHTARGWGVREAAPGAGAGGLIPTLLVRLHPAPMATQGPSQETLN